MGARGRAALLFMSLVALAGHAEGACPYGERPARPRDLSVWITGNPADACVAPAGPALLLMGGGSDVDAAFSTRIQPRLHGGDVVVLRTSGSDGYNGYLLDLLAPHSVETLLVDTRAKAGSDYVDWAVRSAEFVWIAGGDQSAHLNSWADTRTQAALRHVHQKGGLVGGTSAGLAVLADVIYDPDGVPGITSPEAVTNPCHASTRFSQRFLELPLMRDVITDTHFRQRDRMGRLLAFMARVGAGTFRPARVPVAGIGVDQATSLFVDAAGLGVVDGSGAAYVLREQPATARVQVACGQPVVFQGVLRYRLAAGDTYDLVGGASSVVPATVGIDGRLPAFYAPPDPY